jgi:hypothetical protein
MMRGAGGGGGEGRAPSLSALTGAANLFGNREQAIATAVQQAEARLLGQIGVTNDVNGRLVVPPGVTAEQIQNARERARVEATAAVDRALAAARQVYERGGYGRILPDDVPRPVPQTPAPIVPQAGTPANPAIVPPNVAPARAGGAAIPQTGARPASATQGPSPSRNQITRAQEEAIMQQAPPNAATARFDRVAGTVSYIDAQGNVLRVIRPFATTPQP